MKKELYVGDLCYVLRGDCWKRLCDKMSLSNNYDHCIDDGMVLNGTRHGDGCYYGDKEYSRSFVVDGDGSYPVDSGTLGMVWLDKVTDQSGLYLGNVFTIEVSEFENNLPSLEIEDDNGILYFRVGGNLIERIDTLCEDDNIDSWEDEDPDDEYYREEDESDE